jgi:hypothetical protein
VQVICPAGDPAGQVSALWEPAQGSTLELVVTGQSIKLGGAGASDFVALASKVVTAINGLVTTFNSHTHVSSPSGGPTAVPVPLASQVTDVASTTTKAL